MIYACMYVFFFPQALQGAASAQGLQEVFFNSSLPGCPSSCFDVQGFQASNGLGLFRGLTL